MNSIVTTFLSVGVVFVSFFAQYSCILKSQHQPLQGAYTRMQYLTHWRGGRLYNLPAKVGFFKECHGLGVSACMNPLTIMNQPFFPSKFELNILEKIPVVPRIKTSKILTMIKLSAQKIYQNIKILSKLIILYQKTLYFWFGLVENSSNTKW